MKNVLFALAAPVGLAALLSSCSVRVNLSDDLSKSVVTVSMRTFSVSESDIPVSTKATDVSLPDRLVFKAIDSSGKSVYECQQVAGQDDYGSVSFELSPGSYSFVAVAHGVSSQSVGSDVAASIQSASRVVMPEDVVFDTFCGTKSVTVLPATDFVADMNLPRVNSRFFIEVTDALPVGIARFEIRVNAGGAEAQGNAGINPENGFAIDDRCYVRSYDVSGYVGKTNRKFGANLFLTGTTQSVDVVATAYDSDGGVIASHELNDITLRQNRMTTAQGKFFQSSGAGSFTFNTLWETESTVTY